MIDLGVCGYGFSGSGAVLDLLKEYSGVTVADKVELSFIYKPDGLNDLYHNICESPSRYFSSDSSIRRFIHYMNNLRKPYNKITSNQFDNILDCFLSELIEVQWKGSTSVHSYQAQGFIESLYQKIGRRIRKRVEKICGPTRKHIIPEKTMYYSGLTEDAFLHISRIFVQDLIREIQGDKECKVRAIDQAFSANNPKVCFPYFENPRAIVVLRDPRDIYLLAKCSLGFSGSFIPSDDVSSFIKYYKGLLDSVRYNEDPDILTICFEDLIYNNRYAREQIESFLGIYEKNGYMTSFKPEISINNTQLWRKEKTYIKDIQEIEKHMENYLYPFANYTQKPSFNIKSF